MPKQSLLEKLPTGDDRTVLSSWARELPDDVIMKSNCKLCNSKFRIDAENEYETKKTFQSALDLLLKNGENITFTAVQRHLERHYAAQERNIRIKEYAEDLAELLKQNRSRKTQLLERMGMLQKNMYEMASQMDTADLDTRIKATASLKQLADTILSHETEVYSIDKAAEPVNLLINNLRTIISEEVKKAKGEETKNVLLGLFDKLSASVSDVLVPK